MPDRGSDAVEVCDHLMIPETQHRDTALREPCVAFPVFSAMLGMSMLVAVQFERDRKLRAVEVEDIGACRMLAPEART